LQRGTQVSRLKDNRAFGNFLSSIVQASKADKSKCFRMHQLYQE
jgi:hypothetical protein